MVDDDSNPIKDTLESTGVPALIRTGEKLLKDVLGPGAKELGLLIQDQVQFFRLKNWVGLLRRTKEILDESGLETQAILPARTLVPLLEGASLEDDPELREMWANLLVHAGTVENGVPPAFPEIMRQLSPFDAKILHLNFVRWGLPLGTMTGVDKINVPSLGQSLGAAIDNLSRLGLLKRDSGTDARVDTLVESLRRQSSLQRMGVPEVLEPFPPSSRPQQLTTLGVHFLHASLPPIRRPVVLPEEIASDSHLGGILDWLAVCSALEEDFAHDPGLSAEFGEARRQASAMSREASERRRQTELDVEDSGEGKRV